MPAVKKLAPFVVSMFADLRPLVVILNRELLSRGAGPVRTEELPEIDGILHESVRADSPPATRCPRCGGYVCGDMIGDRTCLNCGRPAASRHLEDLTQRIALDLIEQRQRISASEAP